MIFIKKDALRDYATSAFIFWARHGCPTYDEAVERIRKRAFNRAWGEDPQKVKLYADAEVEKARAGLEDIRACESVFKKLDASGRELVCNSLNYGRQFLLLFLCRFLLYCSDSPPHLLRYHH